MEQTIDLPVPPLCAVSAETLVGRGERVVVELIGGRKLIGKLIKFDSEKGNIAVTPDGGEKQKALGMHEIRLMRVPQPRKWARDEDSFLSQARGVRVSSEPLEFDVEFSDHSSINGITFGFRNGRHGIHLFPVQDSDQYTHLFVPNNAIARHRIGKHLGQQLIKDQAVSDQDVAMILLEQQERRSRPLGEHLTSSAVVTTEQLERALRHQQKIPHLQLGEILVQERVITQQQLEAALAQQRKERSTTVGELLVAKGLVTQERIQQSLAAKLGMPFVDLRQFPLDPALVELVHHDMASRYRVLPLHQFNGKLILAMDDPTHWEAADAVRAATGLFIEPVIAASADLAWAIENYYRADRTPETPPPREDTDATPPARATAALIPPTTKAEDHANLPLPRDTAPDEAADFLRELIHHAVRQHATAIHFESTAHGGARIRLRKGGDLIEHRVIGTDKWLPLLGKLKTSSRIDTSRQSGAHTGSLDTTFLQPIALNIQVYLIGTLNGGEDVVLKLSARNHVPALGDLGLSEENFKRLDELSLKGSRLLLICGPVRTERSTLLHALLLHLNSGNKKIWLLDDTPCRMPEPIRQVPASHKDISEIDVLLNADPNVVAVNDLSDVLLAKRLVGAALAGSQILASLPAGSSGAAVERLVNMGVPRHELADALVAVLTQRTAKRLCPHCKRHYVPAIDELRGLAGEYHSDASTADAPSKQMQALLDVTLEAWKDAWTDTSGQLVLFRAVGCKHCHKTGYDGELPLYELLETTPVRQALLSGANAASMTHAATAAGMRTLRQDGIEKALQGHLDLIQVRAVCAR